MSLSTGAVIFQIINKYIVDIIYQYSGEYSDYAMKTAISAIFISTPIYFFLTGQIMKNLFSGELDKDSQIRKWLSYLILLISSVTMIGWLIGTLNGFLNGELTLKFLLKAITSLSIAGAIFGFYFYDIKRTGVRAKKDEVIKIYFWASLSVVVIVFTASLFVVESPNQARNRKMDEQIVRNLNLTHDYIDRYYSEKGRLPEDLQVLIQEYALQDYIFNNPIIDEVFYYATLDTTHYRICATFKSSNKKTNVVSSPYDLDIWTHDAGKYCFTQKIFENPKVSPIQ
jgi:hypothetical protein